MEVIMKKILLSILASIFIISAVKADGFSLAGQDPSASSVIADAGQVELGKFGKGALILAGVFGAANLYKAAQIKRTEWRLDNPKAVWNASRKDKESVDSYVNVLKAAIESSLQAKNENIAWFERCASILLRAAQELESMEWYLIGTTDKSKTMGSLMNSTIYIGANSQIPSLMIKLDEKKRALIKMIGEIKSTLNGQDQESFNHILDNILNSYLNPVAKVVVDHRFEAFV